MEKLEELRKIHIKNINSVERIPETKIILQQIENSSNIDQLNIVFEKYWRIYNSRGIANKFSKEFHFENKKFYSNRAYSNEILYAKDIYEINLIDEKYLIIQLSKTNTKIYLNKSEIKKCKKYTDLVKLIKNILLNYEFQLDNLDQKIKIYNHQYLPQLITNYQYFNKLMKLDISEENVDLIYTRNKLVRKINKDSIYTNNLKNEYEKLKNEINYRISSDRSIEALISYRRENEIYNFATEFINNLSYHDIEDQIFHVMFASHENEYENYPNEIISFGLKMKNKYLKVFKD